MQKCQKRLGDIFQIELSGTNHIVVCDVNYLKGLEVLGDRPIELLGPFTPILGKNSLEFVEEAEAMRRRGKYRKWLSRNTAIDTRNMSELLSCFEDIVSMFSEHQNDFFDIVPILRYPFIKYALESLFGSFESEEVMAKFIEGYNNACISWNDYSSGKIMGNLKDDKNFITATKELRWILKRIILHRKTHSSVDKRFIDVIIESVPLIEDAVDEKEISIYNYIVTHCKKVINVKIKLEGQF